MFFSSLLSDISKIMLRNDNTHAQEEMLQLFCVEVKACGCAVYLQEDDDYWLYQQYSPSIPFEFVSSLRKHEVDISTSAVFIEDPEKVYCFLRQNIYRRCLLLPLFSEGMPQGFLVSAWIDTCPFECLSDEELDSLRPISLLLSDIYCNYPFIASLKQKGESLAALYQKSERELESSRRQVSLELHDEVGQVLTSILLQLKLLQKSEDIQYIKGRIGGLYHITLQTLEEVRRISRNLRPMLLEKLGLQAALEAHIKEYTESTEISVELRCINVEERLSADIENIVYRSVQEGLTNVARHAEASAVLITLTKKGNNLFLQISDNGKGMGKFKNDGLGLLGIENRVTSAKGNFWLLDQNGTSLNILLPLA